MKKLKIYSAILLIVVFLNACSKSQVADKPDGLYASLKVNNEVILLELYYDKAPLTVSNFVGLATGKFSGNVTREGNYYDGIVFHRVVQDFVIQAGDPTGAGNGGPGYSFVDEIDDSLDFSEKGVLAMANSGPNTNGSQFFITLAPTPQLKGGYTIFGKVIDGVDVPSHVQQGNTIDSVKILPKGTAAKKFVDDLSWESFQELIKSTVDKQNEERLQKKEKIIDSLRADTNLNETPDGIFYTILEAGKGTKLRKNDKVEVHYELKLYNTTRIVDSSYNRNQAFTLTLGANEVIRGWEKILLELRVGDKARVVIPPELGYGSRGAGNVIPPEAFLEFTMDVIRIIK